jgi:hypothetical protein
METYHKINAPFMRDMDGTRTGQKGKLIVGEWSRPEFEYLADNEWEFTEKVDGTNIRVHLKDGDKDDPLAPFAVLFGGRSDSAVIPDPLLNALKAIFGVGDATITGKIQDWMRENSLTDVTLFGEGYGPKIQGGGKYRNDHSFVLFDVKIGDFWLDRDSVEDIAEKLGIESVPVIGTGTLQSAINIVRGETWMKYGQIQMPMGQGRLDSQWGDFEAEGIVARPAVPLFDRMGNRIITKIKAKDFR